MMVVNGVLFPYESEIFGPSKWTSPLRPLRTSASHMWTASPHFCFCGSALTRKKLKRVYFQRWLLVRLGRALIKASSRNHVCLWIPCSHQACQIAAAVSHCGLTHQRDGEPPADRQTDGQTDRQRERQAERLTSQSPGTKSDLLRLICMTRIREQCLLTVKPTCFLLSCGWELLTIF